MDVVEVDNFDRDDMPEKVICLDIGKRMATEIAAFLNEKFSFNSGPDFYVVRETPKRHKDQGLRIVQVDNLTGTETPEQITCEGMSVRKVLKIKEALNVRFGRASGGHHYELREVNP